MDATKKVLVAGNKGDNVVATADIDLKHDDFMVDMEINRSEAEHEAVAENEDQDGSDEGVSNETKDIAVKLQTQLTEQHILIGEQQCRIRNLEADSVKLLALIQKLSKEVQLIPKENDTSNFIHDLQTTLQFVQDQLMKQEKHISVLQAQFKEIRRGNLYQPAPAGERVVNAFNSRAAHAAAPPAIPPPFGARAEPPTTAANAFGSCPSTLPHFKRNASRLPQALPTSPKLSPRLPHISPASPPHSPHLPHSPVIFSALPSPSLLAPRLTRPPHPLLPPSSLSPLFDACSAYLVSPHVLTIPDPPHPPFTFLLFTPHQPHPYTPHYLSPSIPSLQSLPPNQPTFPTRSLYISSLPSIFSPLKPSSNPLLSPSSPLLSCPS
ncbi:unnamed protein product [Closterium sp. NIES-65]|nr:unnamed protein product [Closterium sp. NIES-65]